MFYTASVAVLCSSLLIYFLISEGFNAGMYELVASDLLAVILSQSDFVTDSILKTE